jgi:hypothetical protein
MNQVKGDEMCEAHACVVGNMRNPYKVFGLGTRRKVTIRKFWASHESNIKRSHKEIGSEDEDWIQPALDRVQWLL